MPWRFFACEYVLSLHCAVAPLASFSSAFASAFMSFAAVLVSAFASFAAFAVQAGRQLFFFATFSSASFAIMSSADVAGRTAVSIATTLPVLSM